MERAEGVQLPVEPGPPGPPEVREEVADLNAFFATVRFGGCRGCRSGPELAVTESAQLAAVASMRSWASTESRWLYLPHVG